MPVTFGGDPESYMDPPTMQTKSLGDSLGFSPIAAFLDLIGVHRQVAKGPKEAKTPETTTVEKPAAVAPQVLTDVEKILAPADQTLTPVIENVPLTTWGQRWLDSNKPLTKIDPDLFAR